MRIAFLSRSLAAGGAQRQLSLTAAGLAERGHKVNVLVLYEGGPFAEQLRDKGVRVTSLGKRGRWDMVGFFRNLTSTLASLSPDVLYSFLVSSNVIAGLYRLGHPRTLTVWGVRCSTVHEPEAFIRFERQLEVALSSVPDLIIANSDEGASYAMRNGMPASTMRVVKNGFDLSQFAILPRAGERFRVAHGIPEDAELVGMAGVIRPQKDFTAFVRAAPLVIARRPKAHFVCVGDGDRVYQAELADLARRLGISNRVTFTGAIVDMPAAYNAMNASCLLSFGEGFPNTVAEAMACGVPCVVSAVGDAAEIVDTCGEVVPRNDPELVADAICRILASADASTREAQRARIEVRYSIKTMVDKTESLFESALRTRGRQ